PLLFLSSFNYSVHQFLLFFSQLFLSAFFDFTVLYPPFHFLYFLHAMSISSTLSIVLFNLSFLQSILFPIFTHSLSLHNLHPIVFFYPSPTPLSHTPSLYFSPFSLLLSNFSLFTVFIHSHSCSLFFPFFFQL